MLAEPAAPRSIDKVWLYSVTGFEKTRSWTYRGLTLLLAVPFALLCGVFLAILACLHVWYAGANIRDTFFSLPLIFFILISTSPNTIKETRSRSIPDDSVQGRKMALELVLDGVNVQACCLSSSTLICDYVTAGMYGT